MDQAKNIPQLHITSPVSPGLPSLLPFVSNVVSALVQTTTFSPVEYQSLIYENSLSGSAIVDSLIGFLGKTKRTECTQIAQSLLDNGVYWGRSSEALTKFLDEPRQIYTLHSVIRMGKRPQAVLTPFAKCYSLTCNDSSGKTCYSPTCPRRQAQRLQGAASGDKLAVGGDSTPTRARLPSVERKKEPSTWSEMVDAATKQGCTKEEITRQEIIFELIDKSEKDYVLDLTTWHDLIMEPILQRNDLIPDHNSKLIFVEKVFMNLKLLLAVHQEMLAQFMIRQKENAVVETVCDVYLKSVDKFHAYVFNSCGQLEATKVFEQEMKTNATLRAFVEEQMKKEQCRRLKPDHFLSRPRWRVARYPMLLEAIEKASRKVSPTHPDIERCQRAIAETKKVLTIMNEETGKVENRIKIDDIMASIQNLSAFSMLDLGHPSRQLTHSGVLSLLSGSLTGAQNYQLYMFDHLLVICRIGGNNTYIVHRVARWDHVEVLDELSGSLCYPATSYVHGGAQKTAGKHSAIASQKLSGEHIAQAAEQALNMTFVLVLFGKQPKVYTVTATSVKEKEQWMENLKLPMELTRKDTQVYEPQTLARFAVPETLTNCCVELHNPFTHKPAWLVGADDGLYLGEERAEKNSEMPLIFRRLCALPLVKQIEVYPPEFRCIVVLCGERSGIVTLSYDILNPLLPEERREKPLFVEKSNETTIIKLSAVSDSHPPHPLTLIGMKNKSDPVDSKAKLYILKKHQCSAADKDRLQILKEIMIGAHCQSIRLKNNSLAVATTHGFDLRNVDNGKVTDVLDASDEALRPLLAKKPLACIMFRVGDELLMCYREFGVYVTTLGRRSRDFLFEWTGTPTSFALDEPYVLAFSERFIEVRRLANAELVQLIHTPTPKPNPSQTSLPQSQRSVRHITPYSNYISTTAPGIGPRIFITTPLADNNVALQVLTRVKDMPDYLRNGRSLPDVQTAFET